MLEDQLMDTGRIGHVEVEEVGQIGVGKHLIRIDQRDSDLTAARLSSARNETDTAARRVLPGRIVALPQIGILDPVIELYAVPDISRCRDQRGALGEHRARYPALDDGGMKTLVDHFVGNGILPFSAVDRVLTVDHDFVGVGFLRVIRRHDCRRDQS